jgi:hypothetical protein
MSVSLSPGIKLLALALGILDGGYDKHDPYFGFLLLCSEIRSQGLAT